MNGKWPERIIFGVVAALLAFWAQNLYQTQQETVVQLARITERGAGHRELPAHPGVLERISLVHTAIAEMKIEIRALRQTLEGGFGPGEGPPTR